MALKSVIDWLVRPANPSTGQGVGSGYKPSAELAGAGAINIQVCDFDGPDGRRVAQRIVGFLGGTPRVHVQHMPKQLKQPDQGGMVEKLLGAAESGRKWLVESSCDVLLWGETTGADGKLTIRFLCAAADADVKAGSFGLGDTLEMATAYDPGLEKMIFAAAVGAVAPRKPKAVRGELSEILATTTLTLAAFVDTPPDDLEKKQLASFMTCLGTIFAALWRVGGDSACLDRAIKAYRVVLSQQHDPEDPVGYALTQNHMASALQALSKRDNKPEPLKYAADCYRSIIAVLGPHTHANDWALAQIHLGDVLVSLSNSGDPEKHLKGASAAYQNALKIFTRQTMPGPWAQLMNQLGVTLMTLSESNENNKSLDHAASCFRQALEIRRRDVAPLLWAQTANNLGAVTFSIYKTSNNSGLLNEAAQCFEGAAEVYGKHGRKDTARIANNNLERIRQIQAENPTS